MSNLHFAFSPPSTRKPKKMSITQTYFLAHTARAKLSREAARPDHNLRLLVGHANLLDLLMLDLSEAEQEQERWFNHSVHRASTTTSSSSEHKHKHIQWAGTPVIVEEPEEEDDWNGNAAASDPDSDSSDEDEEDSDYGQDDAFFVDVTPTLTSTTTAHTQPGRTVSSVPRHKNIKEDYHCSDLSSEPEQVDDDDDLADLALTRTLSHLQQPPELLSDSGDDSEEDSGPPSPPQLTYDRFSEAKPREEVIFAPQIYSPTAKQPSANQSRLMKMPLSEADQSSFLEKGYYLPPPERSRAIEAF
ncbi:hypothetical protein PRK78_005268 [Emydomyces testavorans]|uniref:Uncharacterized protein n=1 Tax=Emydomyces testavorans TaxID=2070801 RepID=A0AAF0IJV9_9EURO|nr:hypothetical protein PRK78_005268 [Emydomyces testavorans]